MTRDEIPKEVLDEVLKEPTAALQKAVAELEQTRRLAVEGEEHKKLALTQQQEVQRLQAALQEATTKAEMAAKAASDKGVDLDQVIASVETRMKAEVGSRFEKLQEEATMLKARLHKAEMDKLRAELISAAGGPDQLVMELVTGDTPEALTASVAKAKETFARIANRVEKVVAGARQGMESVPLLASEEGEKGTRTWTAEDIRRLSPKEYMAVREQLRKTALATLGG